MDRSTFRRRSWPSFCCPGRFFEVVFFIANCNIRWTETVSVELSATAFLALSLFSVLCFCWLKVQLGTVKLTGWCHWSNLHQMDQTGSALRVSTCDQLRSRLIKLASNDVSQSISLSQAVNIVARVFWKVNIEWGGQSNWKVHLGRWSL